MPQPLPRLFPNHRNRDHKEQHQFFLLHHHHYAPTTTTTTTTTTTITMSPPPPPTTAGYCYFMMSDFLAAAKMYEELVKVITHVDPSSGLAATPTTHTTLTCHRHCCQDLP